MVKIVQFLIISTLFFYFGSWFSYVSDINLVPITAPIVLTLLTLWAIFLREMEKR